MGGNFKWMWFDKRTKGEEEGGTETKSLLLLTLPTNSLENDFEQWIGQTQIYKRWKSPT